MLVSGGGAVNAKELLELTVKQSEEVEETAVKALDTIHVCCRREWEEERTECVCGKEGVKG